MREESRRRYRSSSRDRDRDIHRREKSHKYKKSKKSKKSKKYSRRSSSSSSTSSYESRESHHHHSRRSSTRAPSSESNSRASKPKTRPPSAEISRTATTTITPTKEIDLTDVQVQSALSTIEEDKFEAKSFFSTRDREAPPKKLDKVIIDLKSETVQLPKPMEQLKITKEQIFHPNFMGDPELKTEKWIRKLYNFRRKHFED